MRAESFKIKDFNMARSKQNDDLAWGAKSVIAEIRTISSRHLSQQMPLLLAVVDDQLARLSGVANAKSEPSHYFDAMRHLRSEANAITASYEAAVLWRYDKFWKQKPRSSAREEIARMDLLDGADLSLVDETVLEQDLAVSGMIERGQNLFQRELDALNARLAYVSGREEIQSGDNPLGPFALCHGLANVFRPLALDPAVKLLAYKLYDQMVLPALGGLYHDLNNVLIREGILPNLPGSVKRTPLPSENLSRPSAGGGYGEDRDESHHLYMEAFAAMENLLGSWRSRMGLPMPYPASYAGPTFAAAEIIGALSLLQYPAVRGATPAARSLKPHLQQQLRKSQPGHEARPLARREEDLIDMVSMLFEFILEDRNLPDPVKALVARLQIPVIKVAILETSLFGHKNHPVRRLLNALAQAGAGLDMAEDIANTPVFKRIESIVCRILDDFDQNVNLFAELLDEFTAFMRKENQRSRVAEERTRQVTQSKEQMQLAKRKVAYEIARRLQGKPTPVPIRSFLLNIWKDVLILGYLRRDKSAGDWEHSLEVMDKLLWSVTAPVEVSSRMDLINAMPPLIKSIKAGLEALSPDPRIVAAALDDLAACHIVRLSRSAAGAEGAIERTGPLDGQIQQKVEVQDPELAWAIVKIRADLPDVDNFGIADLIQLPAEFDGAQEWDDAYAVADDVIAKACNLAVGEWVELDEGNRRVRAKLSWKSQLTSTYVFVNRRGGKVAEITLLELAKRLSGDTARIIVEPAMPPMDRALKALLNRLRAPFETKAAFNAV